MQRFVPLFLPVLALACSGDDLTVIVVDEPGVASVVVTPSADTLTGFWNTLQLSATALDGNDVVMPDAQFVWSSSEPRTAKVDSSGRVIVCGLSTLEPVIITATCEGRSGTAEIKVDIDEAFSANFDDDVVDEPPGEPEIGFWDLYGTTAIIVRNTAGDLTNKPVELAQTDGVFLIRLMGRVPGCHIRVGEWVVSWRSLVSSGTACFGVVKVIDRDWDFPLGSVAYRPGGVLSRGYEVTPLPVSWTSSVSQFFELTVDLDNQLLSLSIDSVPVQGFLNVPFDPNASGDELRSLAMYLGWHGTAPNCTSAQTFAWDDIKIVRKPEILPH